MPDTTSRARTVAVMQPYFYPYAGYFRLCAAAETFVLLDDVQFPRRGRVHRCQIPGPRGPAWLTLPLSHALRETSIRDMAFSPDARSVFDARLSRLTWLKAGRGACAERIRAHLHAPLNDLVDFLESGIHVVADLLDLPVRFVRASSLDIGEDARGQDRIIGLVEALGGATYVNSPGGRDLYSRAAFDARGIALKFLVPYEGAFRFLLPALLQERPDVIGEDILNSTRLRD